MAKLLNVTAPKWSKYLPRLYQRYLSCEFDGMWSGAPVCKGRKFSKAEKKCQPQAGSCFANMGNCPKRNFPECTKPDVKLPSHLACCTDSRLTKNSCEESEKKEPKKEEKKPFVSMWETCGVVKPCPNAVERLDVLHYKPTDKIKRIYTQTWKSCDTVIRKRHVCCLNDMCMLLPIHKRPKKDCPETAKEQDTDLLKENYSVLKKDLQEMVAQGVESKGKGRCVKMTMPCCRKVAKSLSCKKITRKKDCLKQCCPHPSFSECDQPELKQAITTECRCLQTVHQCTADRYLNRKQIFRLPPPLPAWPPKERPK